MTPLPALVVDVLVIVLDLVEVHGMSDVEATGSDDVEAMVLDLVEVLEPVVVATGGVVPGAGAGSSIASTQYDFPAVRLLQSAAMEGFYTSC